MTSPKKCPKCLQKALSHAEIHSEQEYRYEGKPYFFEIADLPVLRCGACGLVLHTNDTEERILAEVRSQFALLSPQCIREHRNALKLTQKELAKHLGVAEESISRWEGGLMLQSRSVNNLLQLYFNLPTVRDCLAPDGVFREPNPFRLSYHRAKVKTLTSVVYEDARDGKPLVKGCA